MPFSQVDDGVSRTMAKIVVKEEAAAAIHVCETKYSNFTMRTGNHSASAASLRISADSVYFCGDAAACHSNNLDCVISILASSINITAANR
jgi:hypothetical protein